MNFIKKMFPFISAAASLGGPLGTMAANAVGKALGVDKVLPTTQGITDALQSAGATPEQIAAMQKAEQDFQLQMAELGFKHVEDIEKIESDDRANARAREIAVKDKIPSIMAIFVTMGFFGLLILLVRFTPPEQNINLLNIMLGVLGTAWMGIVSYYFGSSAGSSDKNKIIDNLTK